MRAALSHVRGFMAPIELEEVLLVQRVCRVLLGVGKFHGGARYVARSVRMAKEAAVDQHRTRALGAVGDVPQRFEQLAPGGDVHGRAVGGEQPDVGVFLTVRAAEQDHGHLRAQAFGDGKAAGFADDQIRCRHKACHALHVLEHRHAIGDAQVAAGPSQMAGVLGIVSRDEHEVQGVAERVQIR